MAADVLVLGSSNVEASVHVSHVPARGETMLVRELALAPGGKRGPTEQWLRPRSADE